MGFVPLAQSNLTPKKMWQENDMEFLPIKLVTFPLFKVRERARKDWQNFSWHEEKVKTSFLLQAGEGGEELLNLHELERHQFWLAEQNVRAQARKQKMFPGKIDGVHRPEKGGWSKEQETDRK